MKSLAPRATHLNPRWHLVNLVPIWISQVLFSFVVTYLLFFCFMMCGPYDKPTHTAAPIIWMVSLATIAAEAYFFFARRLRPVGSLVFQAAKFMVVGAQWMVLVVHDRVGNGRADQSLLAMAGQALLFAAMSLPFSAHLVYAIVVYVGFVAHGGPRMAKQAASEADLMGSKEVDDGGEIGTGGKIEEKAQKYVSDGLQWPPKGKLVPNWILQLIHPPFLWLLRSMASSTWNRPGWFSNALTCICLAVLICSTCYAIYYSVRRDGQKMSSRNYLKLQIVKIGALYLLLDLVVLAWGGWRLQIGSWGRSLFGVFVLSILFGSPFIAEGVFAAVEYETQHLKTLTQDEIEDEEEDFQLSRV